MRRVPRTGVQTALKPLAKSFRIGTLSSLALLALPDVFNPRTHRTEGFTIRGSDVSSNRRYANLSIDEDGREASVYTGLEMAHSDWTPLARQFLEGLLSQIFHSEHYLAFVVDCARSMLDSQMDALLVYRKRVRHRLDAYEVNVPPWCAQRASLMLIVRS